MESWLRPRLCFVTKGPSGYGFHLHGERNKGGQFIRKVEPGSAADLAGLKPGDRVVEVNGENVEKESHSQVVERICEVHHRTRLLVVDRDTEKYLKSCGLACTEDLAVEMGTLSPRISLPYSPTPSLIQRETPSLSPTFKYAHLFHPSARDSLTHEITRDAVKRASLTSSTATDIELQLDSDNTSQSVATLLPRLCHLVRGKHGFGFNLHSNKTKPGQFIRSVDPHSAAESADIRPGDKLVEVNGVNVEGLRHSEVVALIRTGGDEIRLLMVDQETDELFHRLGITPTSHHINEVFVDRPASEHILHTPTAELSATDTPVINMTFTDSTNKEGFANCRAYRSSESYSSRSSTSQSDVNSSEISFQVPDEDDGCVSDPFMDSCLRLSPTAAEAKQNFFAGRNKKKAPTMDWSKKKEIFSNF